ncbi:sigma-E processing peptidase SpoIIGA [Salibacterium sp. K-3]
MKGTAFIINSTSPIHHGKEGRLVYYLDLLWGMNIFIHLLLFWGTSRWTRKPLSKRRLWTVSAAGSCSVFIVLTPLEDWLFHPGGTFVLSVVLVLAAFGFHSLTLFLQQLFVFYILSFLTAGIMTGLHIMFYYPAGQDASWVPEASFSHWFVLLALLPAAVTILLLQTIGNTRSTKVEKTTSVTIEIEGRRWEAAALVDTGNQLKDPLSGTPVMVAELQLFASYIPGEEYRKWKEMIQNEKIADLETISVWEHRWKIIPYKTAGQNMRWMFALRPDAVFLEDNKETAVPLLVGMDPCTLSGTDDFQMIVPAEVVPASSPARSA